MQPDRRQVHLQDQILCRRHGLLCRKVLRFQGPGQYVIISPIHQSRETVPRMLLRMNLANMSQSLQRPLNSPMEFAVVRESPIFPSLPPVLVVQPLPVPNPPQVELQPLALRVRMPPKPRLRVLSPPLPARPRPLPIPRQLMVQ